MEIIKKMPLSECRICLGEYDDNSMRALFTDGAEDVENDIPDQTEQENEDAAANPRLNSEIEFCCGIRASHNSFTLYLYSNFRFWVRFANPCNCHPKYANVVVNSCACGKVSGKCVSIHKSIWRLRIYRTRNRMS